MAGLPGCQLCQRTAPRQESSSTVLLMLMQLGCAELGSVLRIFVNANHLTTTRRLCPVDFAYAACIAVICAVMPQ